MMLIDDRYLRARNAIEYLVIKHSIELTTNKFRHLVKKYNISSIKTDNNNRYYSLDDIDRYVKNKMFANHYERAVTLVFANHKGGVGKTLTVYNIAMAMALQKLKVLVVDFDPQANLTVSYANLDIKATITDVLMERCEVSESIIKYNDFIDIIPSDKNLSQYERNPQKYILDTNLLREILEPLKNNYDLIIIDTPPQFSVVNSSGIKASDILFIPLTADYYAIYGMAGFIEYAESENSNINIGGIFLTKYNSNKLLDNSAIEVLEADYKNIILNTKIRETTALAQAIINQQTIFEFINKSNGILDYKNLAKEILEITDRYYNEKQ